MKTCNSCNLEKPEDRFYLDARDNSRRQPCIKCTNISRKAYNTEYRRTHPDKIKVFNHRGYEKTSADRIIYQREWRLKTVYQITPSDYAWLLAKQDGRCYLCGTLPYVDKRYGGIKSLAIDHEHGHHEDPRSACKDCIRGLLCTTCNRTVLPTLEGCPLLQNEYIKAYLVGRPFQNIDVSASSAAAETSP